ncbi:MAG: DNA methyltransferase [Deltaproteobacteria bacterium]
MSKPHQLRLFPSPEIHLADRNDWTFAGALTRELTHCYHDYPARMIPQVAGKLLDTFGGGAKLLFDPYCGTGTSLVEGLIRGIGVVGSDLNPLARLISRAKTCALPPERVDEELAKFSKFILNSPPPRFLTPLAIKGIGRLDFWFKPEVIERLYLIREFIRGVQDEGARLFFQVAFSETVRESSNTRNGEFKLYRYPQDKLEGFNPDVFAVMRRKLHRNRQGFGKFMDSMSQFSQLPRAEVLGFNTVLEIPTGALPPSSVDIVITSPPYGDSATTVAYGQYSRLSAAWLEIEDAGGIDSKLMGARAIREIERLPSEAINSSIERVAAIDKKRGLEVASFYRDLEASIRNVCGAIKPGGCACYVVGDRKVKAVILPTHTAVRNFFEHSGFHHVDTFSRRIPNKRMPSKNSPTNVAGASGETMTGERIVVMRRPLSKARHLP